MKTRIEYVPPRRGIEIRLGRLPRYTEAIIALFNKSGVSATSYAAPQRDRILLDRFFNPVALPSRKAVLKDHKPTTSAVFINSNQQKHQVDLAVPSQQILHEAIASALDTLSNVPEYRGESEQIQILARIARDDSRTINKDNAVQKLQKLKDDLKPLGLALGSGNLEDYDISKGVVQWAKKNAPDALNRLSDN
jgi:hypothetical protein